MDIMGMVEMEEMKGFRHIMNLLTSFMQPMVLKCLVQLGLPDIMNTQAHPLTLAELCRALPFESVDKDHLHRILRYSVQLGLFTVVNDGDGQKKYGLTPASKFLVRESLSPAVLAVMDEDMARRSSIPLPWFELLVGREGERDSRGVEAGPALTFWRPGAKI